MHTDRWFEIQIQKMRICEERGFHSTADRIKSRMTHHAKRRGSPAVIDLLRREGIDVT